MTNLRAARLQKGLSQGALAKRVGCTQASISLLENGHIKGTSYINVVALAKALDCDPADLSFGPEKKRRIAKRAQQDTRRAEAGR